MVAFPRVSLRLLPTAFSFRAKGRSPSQTVGRYYSLWKGATGDGGVQGGAMTVRNDWCRRTMYYRYERCLTSMHSSSADDALNLPEKELRNNNDTKAPRYVYILTWDTNNVYSLRFQWESVLGVYFSKAAAVAAAGTRFVPGFGRFDEEILDDDSIKDYFYDDRNDPLLETTDCTERVQLLRYESPDFDVNVYLRKFEIEGDCSDD